jgi:hypothetical protein
MFQTIRKTFFWPRIAEDVYETVRQCDLCVRNRISEKRKTNPLKLFPANGPLESVSMDILGPLPPTKPENRFLLVISDRYSKVTKTVPLQQLPPCRSPEHSATTGPTFTDHRSLS